MLNQENGNASAEIINAAYGLVQGVWGNGDMMSDEGHAKWNDPEINAAALKAAEAFVKAVAKL